MLNPGAVVWVRFPGAINVKQRPALIISTDEYHLSRPDCIVGLITSQISKADTRSDHFILDLARAGLKRPSAFRTYLAMIPQSAVIETVGHLSEVDWKAVVNCLNRAIAR